MPNPSTPQSALARRALIEDIKQDKKGWLQHGVAALAVSLLGLGIAGSVVLTGAAQETSANPGAASSVTASRDSASTSRSSARAALDPAKLKSLADQRAEELNKTDEAVAQAAKSKAAAARAKALKSASAATRAEATKIADGKATAQRATAKKAASTGTSAAAPAASSGKDCLPVTGGYSIAARFGQVGSWARYHTGFDFAAPVGTPLHAPASGVVTNAGGGPASGWAGNYVTIRYSDGTQSLMAHMSTVSVSVGQTVSACQLVGAIGMTGRTFGPHVHFEIYPSGVTPGDVYSAVNPVTWFAAHGLHP
ncbi:MAG: Murein DD-endopeptidase MepM and murein hydrolase activator NlpD, containing LysM domain [Friedmanniella sp.]|nr:Murein DD-endopeptidase MepM and murein hydrolase activator NlpD, containing LysM domain [Friedmanniella sp.]